MIREAPIAIASRSRSYAETQATVYQYEVRGLGMCGSPANQEVGGGGRDWLPECGLRHVPGDVRRHWTPHPTQGPKQLLWLHPGPVFYRLTE